MEATIGNEVAGASTTATMRTLVGIDGEGLYEPALRLLGRLGFAGNELTLAHVEPPVGTQLMAAPIVYDYETTAELEGTLRTVGQRWLDEASDQTRRAGLGEQPKTEYLLGNPAAVLMETADRERSDLVALGSKHHGPLECFLLGSVGRAFAIGGRQSFLIARGEPKSSGKVRAVFATDHSEYANRCFARLMDMNPQGLGHVTIVTATESTLDAKKGSITEFEESLRTLGQAMVERLGARGIFSEYRLVEGAPEEALRHAMAESESDLLILGARGHGLFERVMIGSLALHVVVAEAYSTLVLRLADA
jgi:nucleotide-binding universal stress UspA family protein